MNELQEVWVVSAARTPIGRFGGSLKSFSATELGVIAAKAAIERSGLDAESLESCVVGKVVHTSPEDAYLSRKISLDAGMPISSHAVTVNRLCGSGLEAIIQAASQIQLGEVNVALAGGAESMTNAAHSLPAMRWGQAMGPSQVIDELTATLEDPWHHYHMGVTAENIADQYDIDRVRQDEFAEESHRRAAAATNAGYFKEQIVPVTIAGKKSSTVFNTDEHIREGISADDLAGLRPVFKKDGSVTAANASGINDGAAMVVVMNAKAARDAGLKPLGRLVGWARAGVEPSLMGTGPVPAVKKVFENTGLSMDQMDVIESNEAFAVQAICVADQLGMPADRVNPNGGAVALGHPVGATGAILTTKCLYELRRTGGRYGLVTMCIGGGQGIAAIFDAAAS